MLKRSLSMCVSQNKKNIIPITMEIPRTRDRYCNRPTELLYYEITIAPLSVNERMKMGDGSYPVGMGCRRPISRVLKNPSRTKCGYSKFTDEENVEFSYQ